MRSEKSAIVGSSPLARGLPGALASQTGHQRIIPARAGFTDPGCSPHSAHGDHPRSRGVYLRFFIGQEPDEGSSPLARGLLCAIISAGRTIRIIPARAGFTRTENFLMGLEEDHPRSRGVYYYDRRPRWAVPGSSPLARGLRGNILGAVTQGGIIPARAGFTDQCENAGCAAQDHPRSRGVYPGIPSVISPCSWIIPARAGFTSCNLRRRLHR